MVPLMSLAVPILVSAVLAFLASFILHTVIPWHRHDLGRLDREADIQEALRRFGIPPGDYAVPMASSPADMKKPEFVERMKKGPIVFMTIAPGGPVSMARPLTLWFIYCVVVSVFAAYIAGRALAPTAHYLEVFRFAGCTAFTGYSLALAQNSIWWRKSWGATTRSMIDGLIYALLTAGTFGWLWPR